MFCISDNIICWNMFTGKTTTQIDSKFELDIHILFYHKKSSTVSCDYTVCKVSHGSHCRWLCVTPHLSPLNLQLPQVWRLQVQVQTNGFRYHTTGWNLSEKKHRYALSWHLQSLQWLCASVYSFTTEVSISAHIFPSQSAQLLQNLTCRLNPFSTSHQGTYKHECHSSGASCMWSWVSVILAKRLAPQQCR